MKRISEIWKFRLVLLLIVQKGLITFSQPVTFNKVSISEKHAPIFITCIAQDKQGVMWFGTDNGLYSYDGNHILSYRYDSSKSNALGADYVESLFTDSNNTIWVGTQGGGLNLLDPATGIVKQFRHKDNDNTSLTNDNVMAILKDKEGTIWVGTRQGLDRLDLKTNKFIHYKHNPSDPYSISHNHIRAIYEDREGTLWIGTGSAWINDATLPGEGGLNRFDKKTGKFTRYMHSSTDPHSLVDNRVRAIFEDSHGIFWVGTAGDGLHTMDREMGKFDRHSYNPVHPEKLSRSHLANTQNCDDHITFITEDITGKIWIGTYNGGINRYDPESKKIIHFEFQKEISGGFKERGAWCAFTSLEGVLWIVPWYGNPYRIDPLAAKKKFTKYHTGVFSFSLYQESDSIFWLGSDKGLIRHNHNNGNLQWFVHDSLRSTSISNDTVSSIVEANNSKIWVGTFGGGLNLYDHRKKTFKHFQHDPKNNSSLSCDSVDGIYKDHLGRFWILTFGGLNLFNPGEHKFKQFRREAGNSRSLSGDSILAIFEDRTGNLWIGTNSGLDELNSKTYEVIHFRNDPNDSNSISSNYIGNIQEDRKHDLWVVSLKISGYDVQPSLNKLDIKTQKFKHYLNGEFVRGIYEDSDSTIWAMGRGLYRFESKKNDFRRFIDSSGIEISIPGGAFEDEKKNLWLLSRDGIIKITHFTNETSLYAESYGIDPESRFGGLYKSPEGYLYISYDSGYYRFSPEQLIGNSKPPIVNLTGFWIGGKLITQNASGPLRLPLSQARDIHLNYNQNIFSLEFNAIDYVNPDANHLVYKLENYDNTWKKASNERRAYYFNVPPGKYIFRIKASNSDQLWAEKDIDIIISPPWWTSWWFRIAGALFIINIFYLLIRWNLRIKFRERFKRLEEERQIAEMRNKTSELEMQALRAQMNPHFIFNSLNSIDRFIMQNEPDQASEYLTKFSRLVRRIFQNSQDAFITLEEELETLKLYLDLETLRFDNHFRYHITVHPDLEISSLKVPPLLIQPYVENAIWHGLMHKEEDGSVEIDIFPENVHLVIRIRDDGVGRKAATALGSKSATRHKSMGLKITTDRIALFNHSNAKESFVRINDLVNSDGSSAGTEVIIKIPAKYD
jgi:ligand-binding sensor domain-containing protein